MRMYTPSFLAKTPVTVTITSDNTDVNGASLVIETIQAKARVQSSTGTVFMPDGKKIKLRYKCFIFKDLDKFPERITGLCTVYNDRLEIAKFEIVKNPDDSRNHIVLELM